MYGAAGYACSSPGGAGVATEKAKPEAIEESLCGLKILELLEKK